MHQDPPTFSTCYKCNTETSKRPFLCNACYTNIALREKEYAKRQETPVLDEPVAKSAKPETPPKQPLNAPLPYKEDEWHMEDRVMYDEMHTVTKPEFPKREQWDLNYKKSLDG